MATDSVMGLFATPEQYQQQRLAQQQAQAMEMAKLTPEQQDQANINMGKNRFPKVLDRKTGRAVSIETPASPQPPLRPHVFYG